MARRHNGPTKPVVGKVPTAGKAVLAGAVPAAREWTFSLRFYRQINLFGTENQDASWFVSVLEKISDLCGKKVEDVLSNPAEKLKWRLHEINWNQKNIPVARSELNWIEKTYLQNEEEFPFWQFSVSIALGRVIGFWDERGVFNIVLLDPSHNMQPSSYSDYKTREAPVAQGEFSIAIQQIEERIALCGDDCRCRGLYPAIQQSLTHRLHFSTMLVSMPDDLFDRVTTVIQSGATSCISDLLEIAVSGLEGKTTEAAEITSSGSLQNLDNATS